MIHKPLCCCFFTTSTYQPGRIALAEKLICPSQVQTVELFWCSSAPYRHIIPVFPFIRPLSVLHQSVMLLIRPCPLAKMCLYTIGVDVFVIKKEKSWD